MNRPSSRAADLAAAVRPQPHVVGEQVREPAHVAVVGSLHEARDDAPMFGRRWLKAPLPARQLFLRTAEDLATRGFVPFDNFGDLPVLVVEDLAQQEHRPRERRQLLQEHQKCHRDRLFLLEFVGSTLVVGERHQGFR